MAGVWVAVGVTGFFGIAFVGFAFFSMMKKSVLEDGGERTMGVVVRFDEGGEDCDIPVIEFQVGKNTYTTEGVGSMPPAYRLGQKVSVIYNPNDPNESCIDARIEDLANTMFLLMGMVFLLASLLIFLFAPRS